MLMCAVLIGCLCGCASAASRDYHFNADSGDDGRGNASVERPWQSIDKANQLSLHPGDRLLFAGGQTFSGNLRLEARDHGTDQQPVVIGSYGQGRATIDAGRGIGVSIHNAGGVVVRDLVVTGGGRGINWGAGVAFFNDLPFNTRLDQIEINNVDASGFEFEGILVRGMANDGSHSGYRHVRIVNCVSHHNLHTGIFITGWWKKNSAGYANQDVYIGYCRATENSGDPDAPDENRSGSGIFVEAADGVVVEHCLADGNGRLCAGYRGGPVGIWASIARHVTFQFDKSADNHSAGDYDGGGFCFDGGVCDSLMQYNESENNDGSGYGIFAFDGSPPTVRDTISHNTSTRDGRRNGYAGIHLWSGGGGVKQIEIEQNRVLVAAPAATGAAPRGLWLQSPTSDVYIHDNVFSGEGATGPLFQIAPGQKNLRLMDRSR